MGSFVMNLNGPVSTSVVSVLVRASIEPIELARARRGKLRLFANNRRSSCDSCVSIEENVSRRFPVSRGVDFCKSDVDGLFDTVVACFELLRDGFGLGAL